MYSEINDTEGANMYTVKLLVEDTIRSYAGKHGCMCMCGCVGNYNTSERARKMAITQILNQNWAVDDFRVVDGDGTAGCIRVIGSERNRVLYLTVDGLAIAKKLKRELDKFGK
jgi:hypothetical protein